MFATASEEEKVKIGSLPSYREYFKTLMIGYKILEERLGTPISVMETADEDGFCESALLVV